MSLCDGPLPRPASRCLQSQNSLSAGSEEEGERGENCERAQFCSFFFFFFQVYETMPEVCSFPAACLLLEHAVFLLLLVSINLCQTLWRKSVSKIIQRSRARTRGNQNSDLTEPIRCVCLVVNFGDFKGFLLEMSAGCDRKEEIGDHIEQQQPK